MYRIIGQNINLSNNNRYAEPINHLYRVYLYNSGPAHDILEPFITYFGAKSFSHQQQKKNSLPKIIDNYID